MNYHHDSTKAAPGPVGPAPKEALEALWRALLDALIRYLRETPPESRRASMLAVAREFLRDNNVMLPSGATNEDLQKAAERLADIKLPFPH
jgi:hypothetical protein